MWGTAGEATDSFFRARTAALTLLYVSGSLEREALLELLEDAQSGGLLRPSGGVLPDEDELAAAEAELAPDDDEDEDAYEGFEDEDLEDEDDEPLESSAPSLRRSSGEIGPHTRMRTSSKGEEFLFVAHSLERWLRKCPNGPLELGIRGAQAVAPLVCCWSATLTHALAPEPLTLVELDRVVQALNYETVEEHVEAMVRSGQVEALPGSGATRYGLTNWGREGISPIVAAVLYECHYPEDDVLPPDVFDAEAAFEMALPLLRLPPELRGTCRLGVQIPGEEPLIAGATVEVARGCVLSSTALLPQEPETWVTGSPTEWCEAVVDPAASEIACGGDVELAGALLTALHETLFGARGS